MNYVDKVYTHNNMVWSKPVGYDNTGCDTITANINATLYRGITYEGSTATRD